MEESNQIVDVGSVVEAVSAEDSDAPLYQVESLCMRCGENGITRLLLTLIPHFRKILLSAFECPHCGERNNEVQFAGEIQPCGCHYSLKVPSGDQKVDHQSSEFENSLKYSRDDKLTSGEIGLCDYQDSACVKILEIDLELASGTLGGVVTTIAGLITKISESLERVHGFSFEDSFEESRRIKWKDFQARLKKLLSVEEPWTLVIDAAVAKSFGAPATDDIKDDHRLAFEEYKRSWEQNEEFGLNDRGTCSAEAAYDSKNE